MFKIIEFKYIFATRQKINEKKWSEQSRYHLTGTVPPAIIQQIIELLGNRERGFLQWLLNI
ncbi:MAG: hypothetical protein LBG58_14365 [Planctomycetaceae bacterium]|jgi:ribosome maturation protein Sdo1|nr:hypothetical protein [Planctomycetaceae bacterium]